MAMADRLDPITNEQFNIIYDELAGRAAQKALASIKHKFQRLLANNERLTIEASTLEMKRQSSERPNRRMNK